MRNYYGIYYSLPWNFRFVWWYFSKEYKIRIFKRLIIEDSFRVKKNKNKNNIYIYIIVTKVNPKNFLDTLKNDVNQIKWHLQKNDELFSKLTLPLRDFLKLLLLFLTNLLDVATLIQFSLNSSRVTTCVVHFYTFIVV